MLSPLPCLPYQVCNVLLTINALKRTNNMCVCGPIFVCLLQHLLIISTGMVITIIKQ